MDAKPLTDEVLVDFALGKLDSSDTELVRAALATSGVDRARLEQLELAMRGLSDVRDSASAFQVSREQITRLRNIAPKRAEQSLTSLTSLTSLARRAADAVATIVFDSLRSPVAGLRSGTGTSRLVHLECDDARITIRCERDGLTGGVVVAGEIDSPGQHQQLVVKSCIGEDEKSISIDPAGYFEFEVVSGTYALQFEGPQTVAIVIDQLDF